ncbi:hypothetical protein CGQ24_13900 [Arthrobacter sp. 7749]|nr:hypothetical protein CGQ24_13900 [Arthrobacter sp. 7749]
MNEEVGAIEVGITAVGSNRLSSFRRYGWEAAHIEKFETGFDAMSVEREILDWWRKDLALPAYLSPEDIPVGGSTKTAELEILPVHFAMERLREVARRFRELASRAPYEGSKSSHDKKHINYR